MIFILLDYNEIYKKQKFSAFDIVESGVKLELQFLEKHPIWSNKRINFTSNTFNIYVTCFSYLKICT